jgi:hypothetical protein
MLERDRGEDGVHDQRADGLSVAHETAQDVPVPFARDENPRSCLAEPRGNRRFCFGRGKRTFEHAGICCNLRKAHSVSRAKRTRSGPESTPSSQARLSSCCSALGW